MLLLPQDHSAALDAVEPGHRTARRVWVAAGACLVLAAVALGGLFRTEAEGAYAVWRNSTAYNHCFLILPVALYLAWQRRDVLSGLAPRPEFRVLVLLLPLSVAWLMAAMLGVLEAQQLLVVTMFQVAALAIVGWAVYRAMLTPFLYLYFLVPTGYFLVPALQRFTAWFTVLGLRLVHIPVFWDGTVIEIPAGEFVVAEACAGLRFLIASVAFGVFFAALMYKSRFRRLGFVALSIVVPIVANGLRAFGLLVLAEISGGASMVMADHIIYGWVFFTFVTFVLIFIGRSFTDHDDIAAAPRRSPPAADVAPSQAWSFAVVAGLSVLLAAAGPGYAALLDRRVSAIDLAAAPAPGVAGAWHTTQVDAPWKPVVVAPDRTYLQGFDDGSGHVIRYVALYTVGGLHDNLGRGFNEIADFEHWRLVARGHARTRIDGKAVTVATTQIENSAHRLLIWNFYVVGDAIFAGRIEAKLAQLRGLVGHASPVVAFVAVAAEEPESPAAAAAVLTRFLSESSPIEPYLHRLAAGSGSPHG
ncbi:MAG TPA: exosortase A [Stellaceae bacterium]|nr:exosortase A [Stellaceae bacterium]